MAHGARNIVLGLVGVAIVGGLVYITFRPEPVPVDLAEIARGEFRITVDADGKTRVKDIYEVAAPITGVAHRSPVEVGDPVIKGETVVAVVEPVAPSLLDARTRIQAEASVREAEAALTVAVSDVAKAQEDQTYATSHFERVQALVERGVSSITQLEAASQQLAVANAALDAADARVAAGQSALERARAALIEPNAEGTAPASCCIPILAPADGVVLSVARISERPVNAGEQLLSVGDPGALEIVADLLSNDAVRLTPGAMADVERWGGDAPLTARLQRIEPAARTEVSALGIDEQRVDAIFDLVSPVAARGDLGDAFSVFLRIVEHQEEGALLVPLSAAFRRGDGWAVFRAQGEFAEEVAVELGRHNGRMAVVRSGLDPGDLVVTHPSDALTDGGLIVERATFGQGR
ncbi:MAG: HlyD family efflux transporter periplasmic adaptor subunit [Pseudomonadota bacterium]